ncbi:hypothetical protein G9C98_004846 [Cotesia typhae]|uniref:C2H2-type domain-containing protein n=1 Tax=Cotesia typhae TaxID=2053667 RepID=A0A8J5QR33_9HYME|nr:hypothetical protein G9C98_004846 [Cotesia typhae]
MYHCDICNAGFNQVGHVAVHKIRHHESQSSQNFKCKFCDESFKSSYFLKLHLKNHKNEKYFYCNICLYKTRWPISIKVHTQNHSKTGLYICYDCGRSSKRKILLLQHRKKFHSS